MASRVILDRARLVVRHRHDLFVGACLLVEGAPCWDTKDAALRAEYNQIQRDWLAAGGKRDVRCPVALPMGRG